MLSISAINYLNGICPYILFNDREYGHPLIWTGTIDECLAKAIELKLTSFSILTERERF